MNIAIVGAGYVGLVTACCLAAAGHVDNGYFGLTPLCDVPRQVTLSGVPGQNNCPNSGSQLAYGARKQGGRIRRSTLAPQCTTTHGMPGARRKAASF